MTVTKHWAEASMSTAPYWKNVSSTPVFYESFQNPVFGTGVGQWRVPIGYGSTMTRTFNDTTQRFELKHSTAGLPDAIGTKVALPAGSYRVVAHAYTLDGTRASVFGSSNSSRLSTTPQELSFVFENIGNDAPGSTSDFFLYIGDQFSNGPGAVYWTDFAVYKVQSSTLLDLRPISGSVTLSDSWSPYARATLVCPIPTADALDKVDPRKPNRVNLNLVSRDNESMTAADLTAMLAASGTAQMNYVPTPRGSWTAYGPGTVSDFTEKTSTPFGVPGGSRIIMDSATSAMAMSSGNIVATDLPAGTYNLSVYVRTSRALTVQFYGGTVFTGGNGTVNVDLPAGIWQRLETTAVVTSVDSGIGPALYVRGLNLLANDIIDITDAMIWPKATAYFEDFESYSSSALNPGGWSDGSTSSLMVTSLASLSGTQCMFQVFDSVAPVSRTFTGLTVGATYTFTGWVRPTVSLNLTLSTTGATQTYSSMTAATWAPVSLTFVATSTSQALSFQKSTGQNILFDQLSLFAASTNNYQEYFDGGVGRVGTPAGFPVWTGVEGNSASMKTFGASTAADLTALFKPLTRTNLVVNPSFESGTTGWVGIFATLTNPTVGAPQGTRVLRATATATNPYVQGPVIVTPSSQSRTYSISAWVKGPSGRTGLFGFNTYTDAAGTTGGRIQARRDITYTGAWQQITYTKVLEASTQSIMPLISSDTGWIIGDILDVDAVLVERAPGTGTYFDGATADALGWDYGWTGTANASTSTALLTTSGAKASSLTDLFGAQYNTGIDAYRNYSRPLSLGLRERRLDYINGTMTLELASDEVLLQDYCRPSTAAIYIPPATTSLKNLVTWALALALGASLDASSSDFTIVSSDVIWNQGESLWSFLDAFISNAGLRLWCDENRVWYLKPALDGTAGSVTVTGLTALDDVLSRDEWGDAVNIQHQWTDPGTGTTTTLYQGAGPTTFTKTFVQKRIAKTAPTGANDLLARMASRGRNVEAKAVNDYHVTPGYTAYISTPSTTIPAVLVSAVIWSFPDDEMTVSTRDLP